ncbi:MAG: hypothetical protein ACI8O8_001719 [Oleiphilaceae bacterium]|jgi:uncharacterized protein YifE (UPF0438 family)
MSDNPFYSKSSFYDSINFPHGFARSGYFTKKEADLLIESGYIIKQLAQGNIQVESLEQKDMLLVIQNQKPAGTTYERIWEKYILLTQRKLTRHHALAGNIDQGRDYSEQSAW